MGNADSPWKARAGLGSGASGGGKWCWSRRALSWTWRSKQNLPNEQWGEGGQAHVPSQRSTLSAWMGKSYSSIWLECGWARAQMERAL